MSAVHHSGSKRGALGELGRCTSKDDCPGTAALDAIPVTTVHPPIAAAIATIAPMAANLVGCLIVSLRHLSRLQIA